MKKTFLLAAFSVMILTATGTAVNASTVVRIAKRFIAEEQRQVSGFTGISSSGSYDVKITMSNKESLRLEGDADLIKEVETVVENGILKIRNKDRKNGWNRNKGKLTVYISAKDLNNISLSGSGNIEVKGTVKTNKLTNALSGSGSLSLTANVKEYMGTISGSGEIAVGGKADKAFIKIGGSGDFEGKGLKADYAEVKVSGSGNASISAEKTLEAVVSGSGNIRHSGAAQVSRTKSGSGSITRF